MGKCNDAAERIQTETGAKVTAMQCDLSSLKSVLDFTKELRSKFSKIDSLILNAGVYEVPYGLTEDGLESHMGKQNRNKDVMLQLQS